MSEDTKNVKTGFYFKCRKCKRVFDYGSSLALSEELAVALTLSGQVGLLDECLNCYYRKERSRRIRGETR